ncbi:aminomethyl-transferring glycine dehydrogenase [Wenyingzhuangia marina]|uniref:glycine dehydrogenase (aminomethyl-transferring) n=1 Tax=Wenyingzhuangia marina TaxID=1195760 RepID=A0A1M5VZV8_9FLAO|nr:aminomethyl-transferring glycine dehydrogenase [Wenyingzhuangia marina]GGF76807.1 glycine dehydrogenase (aminomethyl-transferring) [Wenyingzhuangia marina]SHH80812.1 glycine dehydrogenase [Wenyingzhuangia marina]
MKTDVFAQRHIGSNQEEQAEMLKAINVNSIEELIEKTVPKDILLQNELQLAPALSEHEYMDHIQKLSVKNKLFKNYIGLGYHPTITPGVIQRNILENPGWYTAYTPYQAEIAQGRLEALLNFQTMVTDLTGMEIANASLLDEGTAAAEAMILLFNTRSRNQKKKDALQFFVSENVLPQTIDVLTSRATPLHIDLVIGNHETFEFSENVFGGLVQYPGKNGKVVDYTDFVKKANETEARIAVAADLLSLTLLTPPGEWGADVVVGTTQRFGIPMGYGGPHAAYFATKEEYKRSLPGRIIGVTKDVDGNRALRMALQTREQHIKREKATSNICTAQVLLAVMAGMYSVFHGPKGLKYIANKILNHTYTLHSTLKNLGFEQVNKVFFDTLNITVPSASKIKEIAELLQVNFLYNSETSVTIAINETTNLEDINEIVRILAKATGKNFTEIHELKEVDVKPEFKRTSDYLTNPVFNTHHSETAMMRYIKKLERKDLSLNHSMISLGSCTMKLNAASEMLPLSWPNWGNIHPFVPVDQAQGYQEVLKGLENDLNEITGFYATSLQPNSGAQGEYAGLLAIKAYHESRGDHHRHICLIPSSAHGTNPASAVMAGMKVVVTKATEEGNIDFEDLKEKAILHKDNLSCLMVTYPSTHGVFESGIKEITQLIHDNGGQVYMDGANMNAQVGLTNPATIGADVCHLNLHKTFAIPHGGGGPGVGPICVVEHLAPFLPSNPVVKTGGKNAIKAVSSAPWGSALVCLISYGYIKMLGAKGLKSATQNAILNANYIKTKLESEYSILYSGENGFCAHEMIVDFRTFKAKGIEVVDVAKRLMDYGFHAPTVSFPVAGTLMIEPTESENKEELDTFINALLSIKAEIDEQEIHDENSVLKNAPHTLQMLTGDEWNFSYSRQKAAYPLENISDNKFWPTVRRVDDAYGDRNLVCSCEPIESYIEA